MPNLKEHEKFFAFCLLGAALMTLAVMMYLHPLPDSLANSGVLQILNMIVGAFIGAFGGAATKLFDAKMPATVTIANKPNDPVPTTDSGLTGAQPADGELPEAEKLA